MIKKLYHGHIKENEDVIWRSKACTKQRVPSAAEGRTRRST